ncbi:hypothetical protein F5884DRAFT_77253 [Xylogone sp. PMI_703]|nr:hypothetical protein F5884DRAFT_77253 [Xylogone sp. PMI_703]
MSPARIPSYYSPIKREPNEDVDELLHDLPSNFDVALNGASDANGLLVPPTKERNNSLLDPNAFRRLSFSTVSSLSRAASPYPPYPSSRFPLDASLSQRLRSYVDEFWQRNQGLVYVALSQFFGALMNVAARLLEIEDGGMHPFQILFARMSVSVVFASLWMWWKHTPDFPLGARKLRWLLIIRGFTGFFGVYGTYYALMYLPIAETVVISFLAPSVASYGCYFLLHEPFPRSSQYASLVALIGVLLITRPISFILPSSHSSVSAGAAPSNTTAYVDTAATSNDGTDMRVVTAFQRLSAVGVALIGVVGNAGALTSIRRIGIRAHPLISVNYFGVFCLTISTAALSLAEPLKLSDNLHFEWPKNWRQFGLLIFLGICGFITQFLMTKGMGGKGGGVRATTMIYTNMLFALALDKVIFGTTPGWWSLAGSGLILGSALYVAVKKDEDGDDRVIVDHPAPDDPSHDEEMGMLQNIEEDIEVQLNDLPQDRPISSS